MTRSGRTPSAACSSTSPPLRCSCSCQRPLSYPGAVIFKAMTGDDGLDDERWAEALPDIGVYMEPCLPSSACEKAGPAVRRRRRGDHLEHLAVAVLWADDSKPRLFTEHEPRMMLGTGAKHIVQRRLFDGGRLAALTASPAYATPSRTADATVVADNPERPAALPG